MPSARNIPRHVNLGQIKALEFGSMVTLNKYQLDELLDVHPMWVAVWFEKVDSLGFNYRVLIRDMRGTPEYAKFLFENGIVHNDSEPHLIKDNHKLHIPGKPETRQ